MANTFYTAQTVLKNFVADNDYTVTQQSMNFSGAKYSKMWVEEKDEVTSLLCCQRTRTMFEIFGYKSDYSEAFRTSFDYADVNTPPLAIQSPAE